MNFTNENTGLIATISGHTTRHGGGLKMTPDSELLPGQGGL